MKKKLVLSFEREKFGFVPSERMWDLSDSKRLHYKLGNLAQSDFAEMRKRLAQLLA